MDARKQSRRVAVVLTSDTFALLYFSHQQYWPVTGLDAGLPALIVRLIAIGQQGLTGGVQGPEGSRCAGLREVVGRVGLEPTTY